MIKRLLLLALLLLSDAALAQIPINQLTPATAPLTGTEAVPVYQGGHTKQVSTQQIANLYALPPGVNANIVNAQSANYTINPADCQKTISESGGYFTVTLPAVTGFPTSCSVVICNSNANAAGNHAALLSGFPAPILSRLYPQQCTGVAIQNGSWQATYAPVRFRSNFAPTLYVDTGGSDNNDGLIPPGIGGTPLQTLQTAVTILQNQFDMKTQQPVIALTGGRLSRVVCR